MSTEPTSVGVTLGLMVCVSSTRFKVTGRGLEKRNVGS